MIIAIDGPAGSGKSSTAKAVAKKLGFRHLDSGAFYRAITYAALKKGIPADSWKDLSHADLDELNVSSRPGEEGFDLLVGGEVVSNEIRTPEVNAHVSPMAAVAAVREWLMDQLRAAAEASSLVADGRDIGTVVFPDADLKIFLIAQSEARARRRLLEMGHDNPSYVEVQNEVDRLGMRDRQDSHRAVAPLKQAADAVVLDTTHLTFQEQVDRIVRLAQRQLSH